MSNALHQQQISRTRKDELAAKVGPLSVDARLDGEDEIRLALHLIEDHARLASHEGRRVLACPTEDRSFIEAEIGQSMLMPNHK